LSKLCRINLKERRKHTLPNAFPSSYIATQFLRRVLKQKNICASIPHQNVVVLMVTKRKISAITLNISFLIIVTFTNFHRFPYTYVPLYSFLSLMCFIKTVNEVRYLSCSGRSFYEHSATSGVRM